MPLSEREALKLAAILERVVHERHALLWRDSAFQVLLELAESMICLHHRLQQIVGGLAAIELIMQRWHDGIGCRGAIDCQPGDSNRACSDSGSLKQKMT
ncbi:hypothetical protein [Vulcanococcus limneticus]|uniref:hypothetical protein n=1 Tax=Vulcanococcus limneticus TaxID=2170428 RepID=UPI00398BDAC6